MDAAAYTEEAIAASKAGNGSSQTAAAGDGSGGGDGAAPAANGSGGGGGCCGATNGHATGSGKPQRLCPSTGQPCDCAAAGELDAESGTITSASKHKGEAYGPLKHTRPAGGGGTLWGLFRLFRVGSFLLGLCRLCRSCAACARWAFMGRLVPLPPLCVYRWRPVVCWFPHQLARHRPRMTQPHTRFFFNFSMAPHPLQWNPSSRRSCAGGSPLSWRCRDRAAPGTALSHWSGCWRSRQRITRLGWWWATQASCVLHAVVWRQSVQKQAWISRNVGDSHSVLIGRQAALCRARKSAPPRLFLLQRLASR